jgi:anti-sigma-K factor RskA
VGVPGHDQYADLAELYALGALSDHEKRAFEAHLAGCDECAAEVRRYAAVIGALALTAPAAAPSPDVRGRLMRRVRQGSGRDTSWLAVAAAVVVAVGMAAYALQLRRSVTKLETRLHESTLRAEAFERQMADVRRTAVDTQSTMAVLTAPDLARIDLAGQAVAPSASARAFWSRSRGLVLTGSNLPALPAGRTYQLWVLTDQPAPISAGVLKPDAGGRISAMFVTPPDLRKPVAMAVTIEPEGGVPSPTGDKYLVGLAN